MEEHQYESPLGTVKFKVRVSAVQEVTFDELKAVAPPSMQTLLCIDITKLDHDQALALIEFLKQTGIVGAIKYDLGGTDFD